MNNWAAAELFDKQQRVLDNARVLWRRNLEQNRRDVVRSTFACASFRAFQTENYLSTSPCAVLRDALCASLLFLDEVATFCSRL